MQELLNRIRSYLPLGLGCHWSQASKDYAIAADLLESQAADITSLQKTLRAVTKVAINAENLVISQMDEIATLKLLCDQMGNALELMLKSATHYGEAWAKCYVDDYERVAIDSKEMRFKLLAICRDKLQDVPEALEAWRAMK